MTQAPERFQFSPGHEAEYIYRRENGSPVLCVRRYQGSRGKTFQQAWRYLWAGTGWGRPIPKRGLPLYQLPALARNPLAAVLVVEGEKAADAADKALQPFRIPGQSFPNGLVVTTWFGGSDAVRRSNWRPLMDRDVYLWPDNDAPGEKAMANIASLAQIASLASDARTRIYRVTGPEDLPEAGDAADCTAEQMIKAVAGACPWSPRPWNAEIRSPSQESPEPG